MLFFLSFILSYLVGSLSSAIIVCRLMGLSDPRESGSNNPGATNVMRIGGKKAAYITFLGDFLKGLLPVGIASYFGQDKLVLATALGAFLGHLYPVYFNFKGGKGIATLTGIIMAISPLLFLIFGIFWLLILYTTGFVSLASMLASALMMIASLLLSKGLLVFILFLILTLLVIYRHKDNINRLITGTESSFKKKNN